jgi:hypothetical protein
MCVYTVESAGAVGGGRKAEAEACWE